MAMSLLRAINALFIASRRNGVRRKYSTSMPQANQAQALLI